MPALRYAFLRADGLFFCLSPVCLVSHFARNAQAFSERMYRLAAVCGAAALRQLAGPENPVFATRLVYLPLRGMSRDRLDLLGEEYFYYVVRPKLRSETLAELLQLRNSGRRVVLVSHELDHLLRPMAEHLEVETLLTNRLEFRDGLATGRLLEPVVPVLGERGVSLQENAASRRTGTVPRCSLAPSGANDLQKESSFQPPVNCPSPSTPWFISECNHPK